MCQLPILHTAATLTASSVSWPHTDVCSILVRDIVEPHCSVVNNQRIYLEHTRSEFNQEQPTAGLFNHVGLRQLRSLVRSCVRTYTEHTD